MFTIDLGDPAVGVAHTTPPEDEPGWASWWGNDVFGAEPGYVGAQLRFTGVAGQRYWFSFEFLDFEAGWVDTLETAGGVITNRADPGTSVAFVFLATGGVDTVPFSSWWSATTAPRAL